MLSKLNFFINNLIKVEKPPTVLFRHQNGPIAQSNDGKLIVYPGTTIHMECLWMRRFGNPKWNVSHDYRYVNTISLYDVLMQWYNKCRSKREPSFQFLNSRSLLLYQL